MRIAVIFFLGVMVATLLSGCGKRGAPAPPGPASQITWPKVYPTH